MSGNHTFRVDTSGDTNNLIFESLYKADIPEYIHLGSVYQRNYRRTLEASSTSEVPFDSTSNRFFDAKVQRQLKKAPIVRTLKDSSKRGLFREFETLNSTSQEVDKAQEHLVSQVTHLNAELDRDACNEQLWLQLLELQNQYYDLGLLNKKSLMDKKISIIAKALERIPNSEELLLRYLSIMAGVCDSETILTLFRRALQCSPKSLRIHLLRLRFVLSSFELFSLYTVETICREAFDSLYPNNFAHGLYFLTLLVRILFQSGRNEKALGIYQAVVEYFCFRIDIRNDLPVDLDRIRTFGVRDLFILFWKSLSSRIGQEPRHNWTDWLVTFLKTTEKHYEQIRKLEYDSDSSGNDSSFSSSLESPAKLPSVENREESEEEWMDSDTSSATEVMETSPIRNEKERELDFALVSRPVEREFKEWLYEEQLECSRLSFESCGLQHILQQEVDSPHNSVGDAAEFHCLPRDIVDFIPQDCNIDRSICYQLIVELLLSLRGWPFLDSVTNLISSDLQRIELKEETLSSSFSLANPRDIEMPTYHSGISLFHHFDKIRQDLSDIFRLLSGWLMGNGYLSLVKNDIMKENIPFSFISNVYDSVLFSEASDFHYRHLQEGDSYSGRIAEAFIFFQGIVGGFSKGRSAAKKLLKTCESFSLYTIFAELLIHLDMLDESTSIYHSCLSRLNESTWKEKDSCRPILSYLFTLLIHSGKEWRTRSRQCEYIFRVFIGSFGSKEKEESLSLTEMMMIRNKLHKLTAERASMIWNVGEEMQHFSVLACHLMFELLLGGVEKAKDTLHTLEDDVLESRRKNEGNNLVYSIVLVKLRQLMCLFVFLDWHYSHQLGLRTVRNVLEEALEKYPGDELLLFMYSTLFRLYANDSMESSLRVTFSRLLYQSNASVMTVIAHIVAENGSLLEQESNDRKETNPATWRRIKSLLARSLYETSLACSSLLWIQYLTVLYTERNSDRNSSEVLKRAFYRALTHIPYSKELVLKAFMLLAETLTIREAKDIWSITREKGILFKKNFPYSGDE